MSEHEAAVIETDLAPKDKVYIRPTRFIFPHEQTIASGFTAYDPHGHREFFYPILSDWNTEPLDFLHESILRGRTSFRTMMRRAYLNRWSVNVGGHEILWIDYETLFSDQSFYQTPTGCKIETVRSLQESDLPTKRP